MISRYWHFFQWLLRDALWRNKWLSTAILVSGFLGVIFKIQVFGLIVYYTRYFASGDTINLVGYTFDPRTSLWLLSSGSLLVTLLFCLSAFFIYFSRRGSIRMGCKYEEFCGKRVFSLLGLNTDLFPSTDQAAKGDAYLTRLARTDSRLAGRIVFLLLRMITPAFTLLAAIVVLFYLESGFTMIIAVLSIFYIMYQYRASIKAASCAIALEKTAPDAAKEYRGLIQHFKQQSYPGENREMVEQAFAGGAIKKNCEAYEGRIGIIEESQLISGLFMGLVLGLILLIMGGGIIQAGAGWERLLVYVVALRFAMVNLQTTFSSITSINRFYPPVSRYFFFVKSFEKKDPYAYPHLDKYDLCLGSSINGVLEGSSGQMMVQRRMRLALVSPLELNRYTLADLTRNMLGEESPPFKNALYSMRFATTRYSCPNCSLRVFLDLSAGAKWHDIPLPETMVDVLAQHLPKNLEKPIKPDVWKKLEPALCFALSLLSAIRSDCQWVLMEEKGLFLMDEEIRLFFQAKLAGKISVIVFKKNLDRVGSYDEHGVAVIEENSLIGIGSPEWFETVRSEVEERLSVSGPQKPGTEIEEDPAVMSEMDEM